MVTGRRLDKSVRIVSLIPEATEILLALGLVDRIVGLPADPDTMVSITADTFTADVLVAARPDLVFTSHTWSGGGVPRRMVRKLIATRRPPLAPRPAVYALEPHTLGEILSDVKTVGDAVGRQREARKVIEALRARIDAVSLRSAQALASAPPPRVVCLQQREPPIAAGWWLAELVGLAGGHDVLDGSCRPPRAVTPEQIRDARPDLVVEVDRWTGAVHPLAPGPSAVDLLEWLAASIVPHADRQPDADGV